MANLTIHDMPDDLCAVLEREAEANSRSLPQEVLARLRQSLDFEATTRRDQDWIDQALASGPEQPFDSQQFKESLNRGLQGINRG